MDSHPDLCLLLAEPVLITSHMRAVQQSVQAPCPAASSQLGGKLQSICLCRGPSNLVHYVRLLKQ